MIVETVLRFCSMAFYPPTENSTAARRPPCDPDMVRLHRPSVVTKVTAPVESGAVAAVAAGGIFPGSSAEATTAERRRIAKATGLWRRLIALSVGRSLKGLSALAVGGTALLKAPDPLGDRCRGTMP